jgi:hypothetical protein
MHDRRDRWKSMLDNNLVETVSENVIQIGGKSEWLGPNEAAERLDFFPTRPAWSYFKRLWRFGLLERRSRGRGTLQYRISDLGRARLRWLRSQ